MMQIRIMRSAGVMGGASIVQADGNVNPLRAAGSLGQQPLAARAGIGDKKAIGAGSRPKARGKP